MSFSLMLVVTSFIISALNAAYEIIIDGDNTYQVEILDVNGRPMSDMSIDYDDLGRPLPKQSNIACSSLVHESSVNCPQLSNQASINRKIIGQKYVPSRFTQPRFYSIAPKMKMTIHDNDIDSNSNIISYNDHYNDNGYNNNNNNEYNILAASRYKQLYDESLTNMLYKPIKHAKWIQETNEKIEKQNKNNAKKYGKTKSQPKSQKKSKSSNADPNILLNNNAYGMYPNSNNKHRRIPTNVNDHNSNNNNIVLSSNDNTNENTMLSSVKLFTVDQDGTIKSTDANNIETTDEISTVMDEAITQIVNNMINGNRDDDGEMAVEVLTDGTISDPEKMVEQLRRVISENLGDDIDTNEFEFELVFETPNANSNNENRIGHSNSNSNSNNDNVDYNDYSEYSGYSDSSDTNDDDDSDE